MLAVATFFIGLLLGGAVVFFKMRSKLRQQEVVYNINCKAWEEICQNLLDKSEDQAIALRKAAIRKENNQSSWAQAVKYRKLN